MSVAPAIDISVPASSANLGPAFDAAALALNLRLRVRARPAGDWSLSAGGVDAAICGRLDGNLLLQTYRDALIAEGVAPPPLHLDVHNQIPIGKGCGSSAAARLAGLGLAVHFGGLPWPGERLWFEAGKLEGHWDNAAAAWHGGFVVVAGKPPASVRMTPIPLDKPLPLLLAVAPRPLATEEARRVLPAAFSRADAVANIQAAMLLVEAVREGRTELLREALSDHLHQPFRAALCPLFPCLHELVDSGDAAGVALSGAGPSVAVFLFSEEQRAKTRAAAKQALCEAGLEAEIRDVEVDPGGFVSEVR